MIRRCVIGLIGVLALVCAGAVILLLRGGDDNFTQRAGFAAYFAANPPSSDIPSRADQALLNRFRPRFFQPSGRQGPINFYRDYIANGTLSDRQGNLVSTSVDRELLNRWKNDPGAVFAHTPVKTNLAKPEILGRIDRNTLGGSAFTFLTYHTVFVRSGLPDGLVWWQKLVLGLVGNLDDWHQLDHYTAATVVLDDNAQPVALMLQHHNYQRTYLFGESVDLPADGRVKVDIAIRSNELYPHIPGRNNRRAVSFLNAKAWLYMVGARDNLILTADDVTDPVQEIDYELGFLPPSDAFYTFKGSLGAQRFLMGRSGPPGADYKTLPQLMPWPVQFSASYWRPGNAGDIARIKKALALPGSFLAYARAQSGVLLRNIACLSAKVQDCSLR